VRELLENIFTSYKLQVTSRTFISGLVPEKQNQRSFHGPLHSHVLRHICLGCDLSDRGLNHSRSWQLVGEVALHVEGGGLDEIKIKLQQTIGTCIKLFNI
jgi:hypothetical protein